MTDTPNDPVTNPAHYTRSSIECIDAIEAALGPAGFIAYCRGQVIKYTWRAPLKNDAVEDMSKAEWYAARAATANAKFIAANL